MSLTEASAGAAPAIGISLPSICAPRVISMVP